MTSLTEPAASLLRRSALIVHAPTPSVLRDLFLSDIERRIVELEHRARATAKAAEGDKIAYVLAELRMMQEYWQQVEITGGRKARA